MNSANAFSFPLDLDFASNCFENCSCSTSNWIVATWPVTKPGENIYWISRVCAAYNTTNFIVTVVILKYSSVTKQCLETMDIISCCASVLKQW